MPGEVDVTHAVSFGLSFGAVSTSPYLRRPTCVMPRSFPRVFGHG